MAKKTVIDAQPLFDKISSYTDRHECGIELTDWKCQELVKVMLAGVLQDEGFDTIGDIIEMLVEDGYSRHNAVVASYDLMCFLCEDLLSCSGPKDVHKTYYEDLVRYVDKDRVVVVVKKGRRNGKDSIIGLTSAKL